LTSLQPQEDRALLEALVRERWGQPPRSIERIEAGLGLRRFYRILRHEHDSPASLVARIEPSGEPAAEASTDPGQAPHWLPEPALEPLRSFLENAGLPVPRSYLHRPDLGVDLLEDVGGRTLSDALPERREALYREACALGPRLQSLDAAPEEIPAFGRIFDSALTRTKAWKWLHWTVPRLLGREASPAECKTVEQGFERLARLLEPAPRRLSHRDFKAENLHLVATGKLVLIDVQGAFLAPPEYDLVCLLYDLQVDLPESLVETLFRETLGTLPDRPDPREAELRFAALALMRLCKDVSHIVDAGLRRMDRRRWHEIPRGLELIDRSARRLENAFPEIRELTSVIQALTRDARSTDIASRGLNG
jgi:aminoglycoside/choline kinase family phosphotransferase